MGTEIVSWYVDKGKLLQAVLNIYIEYKEESYYVEYMIKLRNYHFIKVRKLVI